LAAPDLESGEHIVVLVAKFLFRAKNIGSLGTIVSLQINGRFPCLPSKFLCFEGLKAKMDFFPFRLLKNPKSPFCLRFSSPLPYPSTTRTAPLASVLQLISARVTYLWLALVAFLFN